MSANLQPPAVSQNPERLPEYESLVRREIDNTIRDDDINARVLDRKGLGETRAVVDLR
jgi:hypothetical protein